MAKNVEETIFDRMRRRTAGVTVEMFAEILPIQIQLLLLDEQKSTFTKEEVENLFKKAVNETKKRLLSGN